jgi:hypothetical protein
MATKKLRRSCGTMAVHMALLEKHPAFRERLMRLEAGAERLRSIGVDFRKERVVNAKVVVHVVYAQPAENISDAQIQSQIHVLNQDFRATNPDRSKVPAVWRGLATDSKIQFTLAKVTRTETNEAGFSSDDGVKKSSTGGIPPVDTAKYLNIWVCALRDDLLGYAQFPGGPAATDGVVINYRAFGTTGSAHAPFDKGRTATHEVGHYFNLRHIWGDVPDCSGSDMVSDTPNAAGPNFGEPAWPSVTCNNGPNGDMFMNYMDYVDDAAMFMFTAQQVLRMRATIDGPRSTLG